MGNLHTSKEGDWRLQRRLDLLLEAAQEAVFVFLLCHTAAENQPDPFPRAGRDIQQMVCPAAEQPPADCGQLPLECLPFFDRFRGGSVYLPGNGDIPNPTSQPQLGFHKGYRFVIILLLKHCQQVLGQVGAAVYLLPFPSLTAPVAAGPDLLKQLGQLVGHNRFEQIVHAVKSERLTSILKVAVPAENDEIRVGNLVPPQNFDQLQPIHYRHLDVRENQVNRMLFQEGKRLLPIGGGARNGEAQRVPVHQHRQSPGDKRLIIHQQYFQKAAVFHLYPPPPK